LQDAAANGGQNPFPKAENRNATTFYKISALDCKQKCTETGCNNCTVTVLRETSLVQHPATSEEEEEAKAALVVVILLHSTHFPPLHKTIKHHRLQAANLASPRQLQIHRNKSSQNSQKFPKKIQEQQHCPSYSNENESKKNKNKRRKQKEKNKNKRQKQNK
jgi:hypothetical protein